MEKFQVKKQQVALPLTQEMTQEDSQLWTQPVALPSKWGSLAYLPDRNLSKDLRHDRLIFGRCPDNEDDEDCDTFTVDDKNYRSKSIGYVSKVHFIIQRENSKNIKLNPAVLVVMGTNGVYLTSQEKIEKINNGEKRILSDGDQICVTRQFKLFTFSYNNKAPEEETFPIEFLRKYFISDQVGSGGCGIVRLVRDRISLRKYAMKIIKKDIDPMAKDNEENNKKILNEVEIMQKLSHPNVLGLINCFETDENVVIIMNFMEGRDMLHRITQYGPKKHLSEQDAKFFFLQACQGLNYLHKAGITHRDIKPDNILLDSMHADACIKISDFGLSKLISVQKMKTVCGTELYVAPEVLKGTVYTNKVDIWSLGCLLFAMLSGSVPFSKDYKPHSLHSQIKNGLFEFKASSWKNISAEAKDLIKNMLKVKVAQRFSIKEVLAHPWLSCNQTRARVLRLNRSSQTLKALSDETELEITLNNVSLNETGKQPPPKKRRLDI